MEQRETPLFRGCYSLFLQSSRSVYLELGFPDRAGPHGLTRAELALADHPLVSVHLMLDPVAGRIAFAEEQANDFEAAFGRVFDAPLREKFHCLADAVFVL
jgi:hypothetical protein